MSPKIWIVVKPFTITSFVPEMLLYLRFLAPPILQGNSYLHLVRNKALSALER